MKYIFAELCAQSSTIVPYKNVKNKNMFGLNFIRQFR
jgi:hypothetical protein